jgi:pimeloyl-ACP methyl ester carboxylesterase
MPEAKIGDILLYYEQYGKGAPLIMILGLGQDVATWGSQISQLADYIHLIVFDNRDSGKGSRCTESYTTKDMAGDTIGLMNQIKSPTLILVGANDELTPPCMAKEIKSEMPDAKLMIFDEGGHGLYWEIPDLFNNAVINFLANRV